MSTDRVLDHHPAEDHDPASVQRFHIARFVAAVPTKGKYWTPPAFRLDQGSTGHCGGFSATNEYGASPFRGKPAVDPNRWAHEFYYAAKSNHLDPWGLEDGTSTLAMMKVGQLLGIWENYAWAKSVDDMKRQLTVGPLLFGVPYRTAMFSPNADGVVTADGIDEGGHLMCASAWSPNWRGRSGKKYGPVLTLLQSWGREFGDNGVIRIPFDDAADLLAYGEAGVPISRKLVTA
jgi:hypothetical protein